ncbi:hypothetical protein CDAR_542371 [Caerostris darwini]|uniref:Uncharacterized protein n=1 Tax=Caerostris darwini TaxID=1538125 RepID=A0AAV4MJF4_9ARAC|nr:hypothetical protein CDAR_542371 [Caerostris darwini]
MKEFPEKRAAAVRFTLGGLSEHLFSHEEQEERELLFHIVWRDCFPSSCFFFSRSSSSKTQEVTKFLPKAMVVHLLYFLSQFTEREYPKPEWEKLTRKYEEVSGKEVCNPEVYAQWFV